jgi:uncharacterized membrane protein
MVRRVASHGRDDIQKRADAGGEGSSEATREAIIFQAAEYSGPIPPPELIEGYQQAIPHGGERVFDLAEREQMQRHRLERDQLEHVSRAHARGQTYAFLLSLVIVLSGALLIASNKDIAGYATLLVGGGTLLRASLRRRSRD